MNRYWGLLIFLFFSSSVRAQLDFFHEELEFGIDSVSFSVKGNYFFRNQSGREIKPVIYFPVGKTEGKNPIDKILVFDQKDPGHPYRVHVVDSVADFELAIPAFGQKQIVLYYRQQHDGKQVRYILTSTRHWKKPLEFASYKLVIQKNIKIRKFSMKPDKVSDFGNTRIYSWEKKNFMPTGEFTVLFTIKR